MLVSPRRRWLALVWAAAVVVACKLPPSGLTGDGGAGTCGDGVIDPGEVCDDGNTADGDACNATCTSDESCGNGIVDGAELCDDSNRLGGDGCRADCRSNETCGNGVHDIARG